MQGENEQPGKPVALAGSATVAPAGSQEVGANHGGETVTNGPAPVRDGPWNPFTHILIQLRGQSYNVLLPANDARAAELVEQWNVGGIISAFNGTVIPGEDGPFDAVVWHINTDDIVTMRQMCMTEAKEIYANNDALNAELRAQKAGITGVAGGSPHRRR